MTEIIDIGELYYKEKWQGERLAKEETKKDGKDVIVYNLHATNISHCIAKTCQLFECTEKGIQLPFSADSRRKMEVGKAFHKLHQQDVDWGLSGLKDDRFGWYPPFHCTKEGHSHWLETWNFIEHQMVFHIQISEDKWICVKGTLDEFKINSEGFFIEDIKATFGFKWIKGIKGNHKVQIHVYMWLMEKKSHPDLFDFPDNFPLISQAEVWERHHWKAYWDKRVESDADHEDYKTFEEFFQDQMHEEDKCFWDLDFQKCHKAQVKYIDAFNPMRVKIFKVAYRKKYFDFIEEQIEKYKQYLLTGVLQKPNYDYMAKWECDPKYCPFSKNSPLERDCKYSNRENDNK